MLVPLRRKCALPGSTASHRRLIWWSRRQQSGQPC